MNGFEMIVDSEIIVIYAFRVKFGYVLTGDYVDVVISKQISGASTDNDEIITTSKCFHIVMNVFFTNEDIGCLYFYTMFEIKVLEFHLMIMQGTCIFVTTVERCYSLLFIDLLAYDSIGVIDNFDHGVICVFLCVC